jgi:hypothetical protein
VTDSSSCPHHGPRERGAVPLVCGLCGGVEIARAPHSRCARCKGDGRRDPGWETNGLMWRAAVESHLSSVAHQLAIAPLYLETPTDAAPPTTAPHTQRGGGGYANRSGTLSPEDAGGRSSDSSAPPPPRSSDHSSSSARTDESVSIAHGPDRSPSPSARPALPPSAWSGTDRVPCPRCGSLTRRDNLSRHLKRCARREATTP